jgi:hypothetical protein
MVANDANPPLLPNGPAWACILASGVGCAALGLMVDLSEAFKSVSNALNFYKPTRDLSGKTIVAIAVWATAWWYLHARWNNRRLQSTGTLLAATLLLILLSLFAVFPPFFGLLAAA